MHTHIPCLLLSPPCSLNSKMMSEALQGDAMAMFMAMQQQGNPLLGAGGAGAAGGPHFPNGRPGGPMLPPPALPPRGPHVPGQPTHEQMMMAGAEISRCVWLL